MNLKFDRSVESDVQLFININHSQTSPTGHRTRSCILIHSRPTVLISQPDVLHRSDHISATILLSSYCTGHHHATCPAPREFHAVHCMISCMARLWISTFGGTTSWMPSMAPWRLTTNKTVTFYYCIRFVYSSC